MLWPIAGPLLGLWLPWTGYYSTRSLEERQARSFAERILGQQVPQPVARALLQEPDANRLGGIRREVTVLFSDIRGFTEWSDSTPPEEVVQILNEYLREIAGP